MDLIAGKLERDTVADDLVVELAWLYPCRPAEWTLLESCWPNGWRNKTPTKERDMNRRSCGAMILAATFLALGLVQWGIEPTYAQDCGGQQGFFGAVFGGGGCAQSQGYGAGDCASSGGYSQGYGQPVYQQAYQQQYSYAPRYAQSRQYYAQRSYQQPYRQAYSYRSRGYGQQMAYRSRGSWSCGPNGCVYVP